MADMATRMKGYEACFAVDLLRRMPVVVRLDGRAFHSLRLQKPFDEDFRQAMVAAARCVIAEMQNFKLAYLQSDEASFLMLDTDSLATEPWFGNGGFKVATISASLMTAGFHRAMPALADRQPVFDGRAFNVPPDDVTNYFLWRAKDWERNSVQMYARAHFSHKQLHGKGRADMHEMLHGLGRNWATDVSESFRNGVFLYRGGDGPVVEATHHQANFLELDALVRAVATARDNNEGEGQ